MGNGEEGGREEEGKGKEEECKHRVKVGGETGSRKCYLKRRRNTKDVK